VGALLQPIKVCYGSNMTHTGVLVLSFFVKNEGVFRVIGSHIHCKSGSVLKAIKTLKQQSTNRKWYAIRPFNSSNCDGCMSRSFIDCKLFSILTSTSRSPSAIVELLDLSVLIDIWIRWLHWHSFCSRLRERCYSNELIWGPFADVEIDYLHSAVAFVNGFANS